MFFLGTLYKLSVPAENSTILFAYISMYSFTFHDYKLDRFINLQNNKKMRSTRRKKICDDKEKINKMYILNFILMLALYIYVIF